MGKLIPPRKEIGHVAYDAYCEFVGWKSVHDEPLPNWNDQDRTIQTAWNVAAEAVITYASEQAEF